MFEDKAGHELVRLQAERDLHTLVKNDEESSVLRDRTRQVKRNESVAIGNNRRHSVAANERISIGQNQAVTVGNNRATQVGAIDSIIVGEQFVVSVAPASEGWPPPCASFRVTDHGMVLDSGAGATLTLDGNKIVLSADLIEIAGRGTLQMRAGGVAALDGSPVIINGPGKPAGRVDDAAGGVITQGSSTVLIGGAPTDVPIETKKFATAEEAAIDALKQYNPRSVSEGRPYCGWVTKNPDGTFTARPATQGTTEDLQRPTKEDARGFRELDEHGEEQPIGEAWWQTNGRSADPETAEHSFDEKQRSYADRSGAPGYVATPEGRIIQGKPNEADEELEESTSR